VAGDRWLTALTKEVEKLAGVETAAIIKLG
jgi:hypothetical protein